MYLSVFYQYRFVVCPILTLKVPKIIITTVVYIGLERAPNIKILNLCVHIWFGSCNYVKTFCWK